MPLLVMFLLNIAVALLLGMVIGFERQFGQHTAGLRTNALVSVGAALFVSLGSLIEGDSSSSARIASQIVCGIGFLGGGVILREGFNVRGMNTAATLWCSAAIGTLAGSGHLLEALIGTSAVLVIHLALRPVVRKIDEHMKTTPYREAVYQMRVVCENDQAAVVRNVFMRHVNSQPNMVIQGIATHDSDQARIKEVVAEIYCSAGNDKYMNELVARLNVEPSVTSVSWKKA
jgi:putative Mg2+ transporter-C (MgtC) family protein